MKFEILPELGGELEEEAMELEPLFLRGSPQGMSREMAAPRCPADTQYTLIGFGRYSDDTWKLPEDQYGKLLGIIREIAAPVVPPGKPVTRIVVVGHADMDPVREGQEPGFLQLISKKRALAVTNRLCCELAARLKDDLSRLQADWMIVGRGARALAVPNPRTEAERKCNRRVEITLKRSDSPARRPLLMPGEVVAAGEEQKTFDKYYHMALQGTSGSEHHKTPEAAERKAREIGEKIPPFFEKRKREATLRHLLCPAIEIPGSGGKFQPTGCRDPAKDTFFDDALQGAASKFSDPDIVIKKAMEVAEIASLRQEQTVARIAWKHATLPQPMEDDCEFGGRVAGGPVNHVLCRTHGHVLDTTSRMVIAHDAGEYKTLAAGIPTSGRAMKRQFRRRT
jgi:hypothetical protein